LLIQITVVASITLNWFCIRQTVIMIFPQISMKSCEEQITMVLLLTGSTQKKLAVAVETA
jgi:hypothetical protein